MVLEHRFGIQDEKNEKDDLDTSGLSAQILHFFCGIRVSGVKSSFLKVFKNVNNCFFYNHHFTMDTMDTMDTILIIGK